MSKGRRERDRPSGTTHAVAPDNPHKRVLLSYASDDKEEDQPQEQLSREDSDAIPADYQIQPYIDEEDEEDATTKAVQSAPQANDASGGPEVTDHKSQSSKKDAWKPKKKVKEQKNDTTGQYAALGSLSYQWEDGGEDEEYDSADEEAMAYLRGVRSERQGMPTFFKAPAASWHEEVYDAGVGDTRGYWEDGAYVARANLGPAIPETAKTTIDPRDAYTAALKDRFVALSKKLQSPSTNESVAALGKNRPLIFSKENKVWVTWFYLLRSEVPMTAQLQGLDRDAVFELLKVAQRYFFRREEHIASNTSLWIWSLLARLGDVGTMDSDQVSLIREFAKRAILVQLSFDNPSAAEQLESAAAAEGEDLSDELPNKKIAMLRGLEGRMRAKDDARSETSTTVAHRDEDGKNKEALSSPNSESETNTLATLDAIVAIAGEVFGQRDLLEFRRPWAADEQETTQSET